MIFEPDHKLTVNIDPPMDHPADWMELAECRGMGRESITVHGPYEPLPPGPYWLIPAAAWPPPDPESRVA